MSKLILEALEQAREVMTRDEAAGFLRISTRKLDQLCKRGLVPYSIVPTERGSQGRKLFLRERLLETIREWERGIKHG